MGILGVRVDTAPSTGFCYLATYHNLAEDKTDYAWGYVSQEKAVVGQKGTVIRRKHQWGVDKKLALLDCALIQLSTQYQSMIAPGLYQGAGSSSLTVRGTNLATPGTIAKKYGMTTGLTYGRVINLPSDIDKSCATHIFAAERCDSNGYPMSGDFCRTGDSGAPVIDMSGYVLGLVVQGRGYDGGTLGLINRIDQIQAALDVTLHAD
ncbi:Peptidase cysteine/serine, trypsin-like protein, partial [Metarhizium majus ARSEF 297]